ncbi:MAG: hypothetical protein ACYTGB_04885 [Planctomycetota bacterium]
MYPAAAPPKNSRPAPGGAGGPADGGWRSLARWLFKRAGSPFELLAERRHPVVRAEMRRTARRRLSALAFCVGLPLLLFVVGALLGASRMTADALGIVVCFWPLVMYVGAALACAGAVMEEIEQETALQLVLTPVPARPLAAAKVLPRVQPYLWGIVAALPLYCLMGSSRPLLIDNSVPNPLMVWPLRTVAPFVGGWSAAAGVLGVLVVGPTMCALDLVMIWAGAQWGAVFAIRGRGLLRTAASLAWHLLIQSAVVGLCLLGGVVVGMLPVSCAAAITSRDKLSVGLGVALGTVLGLGLFGFLLWRVMLCRATEEVLTAFQAFDRLANEEFSLGLPRWVERAGGRKPKAK